MARPALIFFGSDNVSLAVLEALWEAQWPIGAIITKPDSLAGRGRALTPPPIKVLGTKKGLLVLQPQKLSEVYDQLTTFGVQYGVVASYGQLIPDRILELFPGGLINVHPSLLPTYRGPAPIEAPILAGDSATGVTLMQIAHDLDAGPIYAQETVPLTGRETAPELSRQLAQLGARLLTKQLPAIIDGRLRPEPQDDTKATYTQLITKADGQIDWAKPAVQIEREIRAYLGWPGSHTVISDRPVTITAAHIQADEEPKALTHATGNGTLVIDRLIPAGKREMTAQAFLAGRR